jgi:glutamine transport system substrate-binding protein
VPARISAVVLVLALAFVVVAVAEGSDRSDRSRAALVVGLNLPDAGFQVGAVRGRTVTYATGYEIELIRAVARRLGIRMVQLVQISDRRVLLRPGGKPWGLAAARLVPHDTQAVAFSSPYLRADQAVLVRPRLARPGSLAELASLQLCAVRDSRGARLVRTRVRPALPPLPAPDTRTMLRWVQTGRCDAALHEAPALGVAMRNSPAVPGRVVGLVATGAAYAFVLPARSAVAPRIETALRRLRADGTLHRLALRWLGFDPNRLPVLR